MTKDFIGFYILGTSPKILQAPISAKIEFSFPDTAKRAGLPRLKFALFACFVNNCNVPENQEEVLKEFGKRVQRCYGCYISYYLKDMYLGEDVTFFCEHCKDETMFHFDDFSRLLDLNKLREVSEHDHHH